MPRTRQRSPEGPRRPSSRIPGPQRKTRNTPRAARYAQRAGVFALVLVALSLAEALTILTGMPTAMRDLVLMMSVTPKY